MDTCPSGCQVEITYNDQRATVVEVRGGLRLCGVGDRCIFRTFPIDAICDGVRGLRPSPDPTARPTGSTASTGSRTKWRSPGPRSTAPSMDSSAGERGRSCARRTPGWRWRSGGAGQHPYLSPGVGLVDQCKLQLDAGASIVTYDERQLPTGAEAIDCTNYDSRESRRSGPMTLDSAFTDLVRGGNGRAWARLGGTIGRQSELWVDESYPTIDLYTGDTLGPGRRRRGLGTEPMPCPTNAVASGDGLTRLEPGQSMSTAWGVRLT